MSPCRSLTKGKGVEVELGEVLPIGQVKSLWWSKRQMDMLRIYFAQAAYAAMVFQSKRGIQNPQRRAFEIANQMIENIQVRQEGMR